MFPLFNYYLKKKYIYIYIGKRKMTTIIENLTQLMTTTPNEDKQFLNEVIQEIKVKRPRGRPRLFTSEESIERRRACDKRRYDRDPQKKIEAVINYRLQKKTQINQ